MKKNIAFYIIAPFLLLLNSCLLKKNNEYASDFNSIDNIEFSKKYYTLFNSSAINFSKIKTGQPYYILGNNSTAQIVVFSDDKFMYASPSLPISYLTKPLPLIKLGRRSYFTIENDVIKIESIATSVGNIYTVIEEGKAGNDTIFMKKSYKSKGTKNEHSLFTDYIFMKGIKAYKLGSDYYIESK